MATWNQASARPQVLGFASVVLGLVGAALYWWTPLGMLLSLTGLLIGAATWVRSVGTGRAPGWAVAATLLCLAALTLDLVAAWQGWELIQLTAF
jgi:hypothetical protein